MTEQTHVATTEDPAAKRRRWHFSKITKMWRSMLARSTEKTPVAFTVREIAQLADAKIRFTRQYMQILARNNYLGVIHRGTSPHDPSTFLVGVGYRGQEAPQLAGGSGGGGKMGLGWKRLPGVPLAMERGDPGRLGRGRKRVRR